MIEHMKDNPTNVKRALNIIQIAAQFERIADLATNISEEVIFMVDGATIKHKHDQ